MTTAANICKCQLQITTSGPVSTSVQPINTHCSIAARFLKTLAEVAASERNTHTASWQVIWGDSSWQGASEPLSMASAKIALIVDDPNALPKISK